MTDQPDQTIIVKYMIEAQEALAKARELQEATDKVKSSAASSKQSFEEIAAGIRKEGEAANWSKQQINDAIEIERQKFQQLSTTVKQTTQNIQTENQKTAKSFGAIAVGIAAAFGISAISTIRNFFNTLINYAKEGIQAAYDFGKGMFQLQVGVNALRRAGTAISLGDVLAQLQKLKTEFGIFSTKELVMGASAFLNLNRDMGFTENNYLIYKKPLQH